MRADVAIFSQPDALPDDGEGAHARAVADDGVGLDERARVDAHQLAELCGRMHVGLGIHAAGQLRILAQQRRHARKHQPRLLMDEQRLGRERRPGKLAGDDRGSARINSNAE